MFEIIVISFRIPRLVVLLRQIEIVLKDSKGFVYATQSF